MEKVVRGASTAGSDTPPTPTSESIHSLQSIPSLHSPASTRDELARALERLHVSEAALRESERWLAAIVDSTVDAIISLDDSQRIVGFNRSAERIFGPPAADMLGRSLDALLPARFREGHAGMVADYTEHGASARHMGAARVTGLRADGREFPASACISRSTSGGRRLTTVVLRDEEELARAEDANKDLTSQLHHRQRLEALGTLAGGVAHDFNNILMAIGGNLDLAEADAPRHSLVAESLGEIRRASERGAALVKQILAFSRKRPAEPPAVVELGSVVRDAVRLLRAALPPRVSLRLEIAPETPAVRMPPTQIEQVAMNLCTNAWHAVGAAGVVRVSVEAALVAADSAAARRGLTPGAFARLRVSDEGCGMDRETLDRIFEPFFTTKPQGEGTGLGLAVVHGIVTSHGGAILVESQPGVGSTFEVYLPASEFPTKPPSPPPEQPTKDAPGRGLILVVDDEPTVAIAWSRMLERAGFEVVTAVDASVAIETLAARHGELALLLTDLSMPRHDGVALAREANRLDPALPVVFATCFATPGLATRVSAFNVREVLAKPLALRDLVEAVSRHARRVRVLS